MRVFLAALLCLLIATVFADDYFSSEVYKRALAGDPDAQFDVGMRYYYSALGFDFDSNEGDNSGKASRKITDSELQQRALDQATSVMWFRRAAEQGHANAQYNLAVCYYNGDGVEMDFKQAYKWYKASADNDFDPAWYILGTLYEMGFGTKQDLAEAIRCYSIAAEHGDADAEFSMGECFWMGKGVVQDRSEALRCYQLAAQDDHEKALTMLGDCHYYGWEFEQDYSKAINWYRRAAERGGDEAGEKLGLCYLEGLGVDKDPREAYKWFSASLTELSRSNLADLLYQGLGVDRDLQNAYFWYATLMEQDGCFSELGEILEQELSALHRREIEKSAVRWMQDYWSNTIVISMYTGQIQFANAKDLPLSLDAMIKLNAAAKTEYLFEPSIYQEESWNLEPDVEISRLGLKRNGTIAFGFDPPKQISSANLKTILRKKLKSNPDMLFLIAAEDENQTGSIAAIVKLIFDLGSTMILVRQAGPDPDREAYAAILGKQNKPLDLISAYADFQTITMSQMDTQGDMVPFEYVIYEDPPIPIGHITPEYPEFFRRAGVQGTVVLEVEVYKDGRVGNVVVKKSVQSGPGGLDQAAIEAIKAIRFQPGKSGGMPVDTIVIIPIEFKLN